MCPVLLLLNKVIEEVNDFIIGEIFPKLMPVLYINLLCKHEKGTPKFLTQLIFFLRSFSTELQIKIRSRDRVLSIFLHSADDEL